LILSDTSDLGSTTGPLSSVFKCSLGFLELHPKDNDIENAIMQRKVRAIRNDDDMFLICSAMKLYLIKYVS